MASRSLGDSISQLSAAVAKYPGWKMLIYVRKEMYLALSFARCLHMLSSGQLDQITAMEMVPETHLKFFF